MVSRYSVDAALVTMADSVGRQAEAWRMRIDKAGPLCYKHSVLVRERPGRHCNAYEDAWG
jgi:hypothetical protein